MYVLPITPTLFGALRLPVALAESLGPSNLALATTAAMIPIATFMILQALTQATAV